MSTTLVIDLKKKKGENDVPGLINATEPQQLGPKVVSRVNSIRKPFSLSKEAVCYQKSPKEDDE